MKIKFPLYPFLFACFPVLFLYSQNVAEVPLSVVTTPLALILAITVVFFFILKYVFSNSRKAALVVLVLLVYVFSYGHVFGNIRIDETLAVSIWSLVFLFILFLVIKSKKDLRKLTVVLNIITIALIIISAINIFPQLFKNINISSDVSEMNSVEIKKEESQDKNLPDIYYLIFDKYASAKSLKDYYNFDNSEFISFLEDEGFYVAEESHSNYTTTDHSLISSLSLNYLDNFVEEMGKESNDWRPLYRTLGKKYTVWEFLESKGYKYIHIGNWYHHTKTNECADINIISSGLSDFSLVLLKTTVFYPFTKGLISNLRYLNKDYNHYNTIIKQFDSLNKIPDIKEPTFTFAHILLPHDPYVFNKDGSYVTHKEKEQRGNNTNYINQMIFTNEKIKELTKRLLNNSDSPPIMIFQADEGPYPEIYMKENDYFFSAIKATPDELKEKTGILNAYYLPGINTSDLYPNITPVNSFRYIFNKFFGTNFALLEDKSYAHTDTPFPYNFIDITEIIK